MSCWKTDVEGILIHQLFEEQVERTPASVAVVDGKRSLTYAQLNGRANQLARRLIDAGVIPDQPVGLCIERSLEMVIGLLGILKAGGAYVPLDPQYPQERLRYMLGEVSPKVVLTQELLKLRLPEAQAKVIALDTGWSDIAGPEARNLAARELGVSPRNLAYVIFTSGSTGQPKGAMNEHRGVVNRLQWMQDAYQLSVADRVLQKTPFSFDVSVWEFFWTLMTGARLIMARPEGHKDPAYLRGLIREAGITTLHFVPSMLGAFLEHYRPGECPSLRHVICSGEELSPALLKRCFEFLPTVKLSNLYGPTEAAVDVTAWECSPADQTSRIPIGRPIANIEIHLLDSCARPVPVAAEGEIYIGGVGVGRGYLNRPELTAQRFVADPFSTDPCARLYKTGDLGRWRADGALDYLGRNDHQVKIRGFRIELGEIEAHLAHHPRIKEAVVVAHEGAAGDKRLVAYVAPRGTDIEQQLVSELRAHLNEKLPPHMIPSFWVIVNQLPLTQSGKVDRRALPEPRIGSETGGEYVAPRTQTERALVEIWKGALRVDQLGLHDDFFDLGGHSLHAMEIIAKIAERLEVELSVVEVLQFPTVETMAGLIESRKSMPKELTAPGLVNFEEGVI